MIGRAPTTKFQALDWHRRALAGDAPPVTHEPHCGFFRRRLVRGGPWVPACIWLDQNVGEDGELMAPETFLCVVGDATEDAEEQWTYLCANPISESEYRFLMADRLWAITYARDEPSANPGKAIDFNKIALPF